MSTFNGIIKEYPMISIDKFIPYNFKSTVFFLSHCHMDHQKGLDSYEFFNLLEKRDFSRIYVQEVTQHLLKNDYRYSQLSNYVIGLPLEEPTVIVVPDENGGIHSKVVVTLLPAGHCLGSVMFLIEGHNGKVLYTGDFRLPVGGSARLTKLYDENGKLKPIESLYIDTTFCQRKYLHFPPREKCLSSMFDLVEQWLKKGPNYIVAFSSPAQYNYEFLFVELYEKFKVKIHVSANKLRKYKGIKSIEDVVTTNPTETQIHACRYNPEKILKDVHIDDEPCDHKDGKPCIRTTVAPCGFHTPDRSFLKFLIIKPCAKSFDNYDENGEVAYYDKKDRVHKICFSTHSSLSEVRDMVFYIKPKYVYPNVVEEQTEEEILGIIFEEAPLSEDSSNLSHPPLGTLKVLKKDDSYSEPDSLPFFDECYQIPPPNLFANTAAKSAAQQVKQIQSIWDSSDGSEAVEETKMLINIQPSAEIKVPEHENSNMLKWSCSLFSNDENLDPNLSFGSSPFTFEINSTPGDSEEQAPKLFSSPESKTVVKSSSPKNDADLVHSSVKEGTENNNSILFSKTSPSPESKVVLDQNDEKENTNDHTVLKSHYVLSEKIICNPLEFLFSETSSDKTPSDLNDPKDSSTPSITKNSLTKDQIDNTQQFAEKPTISNSSCVESKIEEKPEILVGSSACKSWRHSKLIDNNECINPNSVHSPVQECEKENQTMHVIGKPKQRDSDSENQSSMEDLVYFSKLINEVTEREHKKTPDNFEKSSSSKHLVCSKEEDLTIRPVSKEPLLNSNFTGTSEVPSSVKPIHGNTQVKQVLDFLNDQSNNVQFFHSSTKNNSPNNKTSPNLVFHPKGQVSGPSILQPKNTVNIQPSQFYFKPNPLRDISASKYEKSLYKVKGKNIKKVQNDDSDDIVVLDVLRSKPTSIEVIDLSSDDSCEEEKLEVSSNKDTSNLSKEKLDSRNVLDFKDDIALESLYISPSLLTEKYIPKESPEKIFTNSLGNKTTKRKSDENEYMFIKSLRTETSVDHVHCYEDACIDSTPEDLLIQKK